jgi:hypothetical protein
MAHPDPRSHDGLIICAALRSEERMKEDTRPFFVLVRVMLRALQVTMHQMRNKYFLVDL